MSAAERFNKELPARLDSAAILGTIVPISKCEIELPNQEGTSDG